jgi:hypothetical protein
MWVTIAIRAQEAWVELSMPSIVSMSNKSLEEQIEERIRRDQAILEGSDAESDAAEQDELDERSGCHFPLAVLLAVGLMLCTTATALARLW